MQLQRRVLESGRQGGLRGTQQTIEGATQIACSKLRGEEDFGEHAVAVGNNNYEILDKTHNRKNKHSKGLRTEMNSVESGWRQQATMEREF